MNKKGSLADNIWIIIILFIVMMVLVCGFWLVATAGPLVVGEGKALTNIIQNSVATQSPNSSLDNATTVAATTTTNLLGIVESIVYFMFFGFIIGFVAVCYYARTYKWLAVFWIALVIGAVFISFIVSNAYQQASTSADLDNFYQAWGTNDFLMNYLPYLVGALGIITGIILFVIISTDPEEETKQV